MSISIIKDPNLKFAIIAILNRQDFFIEEAVKIKKIKFYTREYNQAPFHWIIKEVYDYYVNVEIEADLLNSIRVFNPQGYEKCYGLILKEWDGEDDTYYIKSLEGIENLTSMETFDTHLLHENSDISALLKCPSLKSVKEKSIPKNEHTEHVLKLLKEKRVQMI